MGRNYKKEYADFHGKPEEIEKSIRSVLLDKPALDGLLAKYVHQPDGGATDRAVERILELC